MQLEHVLAAVDSSEAGMAALTAAMMLAHRAKARVTALRVIGPEEPMPRRSVPSSRPESGQWPSVQLAISEGLPGIEIPRFAESNQADLIVLGRKRRTEVERLHAGDTADTVVRRSPMPCLFVAPGERGFDHCLAAVDGTHRGMHVLTYAHEFAQAIRSRLQVMTVEPNDDEVTTGQPSGRIQRLAQSLQSIRHQEGIGDAAATVLESSLDSPLVSHGRVVDEVVKTARRNRADVLVVGHHPGGPSLHTGEGGLTRRFLKLCPSMLLTVPL